MFLTTWELILLIAGGGLMIVGLFIYLVYVIYYRPRQYRSRPLLELGIGADGPIDHRELYEPLFADESSDGGREAVIHAVRFHLRSSFQYSLRDSSPNPMIGTRTGKFHFIVQTDQASNRRPFMLSAVPVSAGAVAPYKVDAGRSALKRLLQAVQHPYVTPVLDIDYLPERNLALTYRHFCPKGSLQDVLQGTDPLMSADKKKKKARNPVAPLQQAKVWRFGRQILEGLSFFAAKGIPYTHLHTGNVLMETGSHIRLSDYESDWLGLKPRRAELHSDAPAAGDDGEAESVDMSQALHSFAHIFHYIATGMELDTPRPIEPLVAGKDCSGQIAEVLNMLFFPRRGSPPVTVKSLLRHNGFASVVLSADTSHKQTVFDGKQKALLRRMREGTAISTFEGMAKRRSTGRLAAVAPSAAPRAASTRPRPASSAPPRAPAAPKPPPAPAPPPAGAPAPAKSGARAGLLSSIEGFASGRLKRTETRDASAPRV